jgi:SPP1 family predicted phage head-tail adaptor
MPQLKRLSTGTAYQSTGARNQKIQILQPASGTQRDSNGEFPPAQVFAEAWARVQDISHQYTDRPQITVTEATDLVILDFIPGVIRGMSVQAGTRIMNIETVVDPDGRQIEMWIYCYDRGK